MTKENNKTTARRILESWNYGPQAARKARDLYFAPEVRMHMAGMPGPMDREGLEGMLAMFGASFGDDEVIVEDLIAEGDLVTCRWTWKCTHRGDFQGIPATGKRVTITGVHTERYSGGKVAERWALMDQLGMLQQIAPLAATAGRA